MSRRLDSAALRSARTGDSARSERRRGAPESKDSGRAKTKREAALVGAARAVRRRAYAPYSRFRVGAAVQSGARVFDGANVENASYGLTVCAERAAVAAAVAAGARRVDAIAIASGTSPPTPPCGMCLQTLAEFARPTLPIFLAGARGATLATTLAELLPQRFSRRFLR